MGYSSHAVGADAGINQPIINIDAHQPVSNAIPIARDDEGIVPYENRGILGEYQQGC